MPTYRQTAHLSRPQAYLVTPGDLRGAWCESSSAPTTKMQPLRDPLFMGYVQTEGPDEVKADILKSLDPPPTAKP